MDIILLCFQVFVWVSCIFKLWNRNRFYAIFCMVIYLYLLPTEITYRFFPYLYDAYWGKDVWCELYWFVNFSLITLFIVLNHTSKIHKVYNVVYYGENFLPILSGKWIDGKREYFDDYN